MLEAGEFDLQRFLDAQAPVYHTVLEELAAGQKRSHWMWFIFPQLRGLGSSSTAFKYGLASRAEARAFSEHAILGPRLRECTSIVMTIEGRTAEDIFSYPDHLKFRSCMTLFAQSARSPQLFRDALLTFCGGQPDERTLELLKQAKGSPEHG